MKALLASIPAIALICPVQSDAASNGEDGRRTVELIFMPVAQQAATARNAREPMLEVKREASASSPFRVHDLSRRRATYGMGNAHSAPLRSLAAGEMPEPDETTRRAEPLSQLATSHPASSFSIEAPLWMRGEPRPFTAAARYVPTCTRTPYRATGFLQADAELRRESYYGLMSNIACEYGVPVGLFDAMIMQESRYRHAIFSPKSAFGLTQLMPQTALTLGIDRYSVEGNLRGGAMYLRQQLDRFGQYHLALAAYNAGPGRVRNGRVPRIPETLSYVGNVLANWSRLAGLTRRAETMAATSTVPVPAPTGRGATVSTF